MSKDETSDVELMYDEVANVTCGEISSHQCKQMRDTGSQFYFECFNATQKYINPVHIVSFTTIL